MDDEGLTDRVTGVCFCLGSKLDDREAVRQQSIARMSGNEACAKGGGSVKSEARVSGREDGWGPDEDRVSEGSSQKRR